MNKIKEIKKFVTKRKIMKFLIIYKKELEKENVNSFRYLSLNSRKKLEKIFLKYFKATKVNFNGNYDIIWIDHCNDEPVDLVCYLYCIYEGVIDKIMIDTLFDYLDRKVKISVC